MIVVRLFDRIAGGGRATGASHAELQEPWYAGGR